MISVETINSRHSDILLRVFLSLLLPQKLPDIKYFLTGFTLTFYNVVVVKNSREEIVDIKTNTGNDWNFEPGTSLELICQGNGSYLVISRLLPSQNVWTGSYGTPRLFSEVFLLLHYKFLNHQFHCWLERVGDLLGQSVCVCLSVWMSMIRVWLSSMVNNLHFNWWLHG